MKRLMRKQRTSGTVLLAATALISMFIQVLSPHCICGPNCAMQQVAVAKVSHACCGAAADTSAPRPVSGANLVVRCNCPPALHEAAPVIANTSDYGHEHFKVLAVAATLPSVVAARDFSQVTISESPPPKQGLIILKRSLRC